MIKNTLKQVVEIITFCLISIPFIACNKEEAAITPNDYVFSTDIRFTFPQGDNVFDERIATIYEEYGVRLVYREIDSIYLHKAYKKPIVINRRFNVEMLTVDTIPILINYLDTYFFKHIPKDLCKKTFAISPYFYLLNKYGDYFGPSTVLYLTPLVKGLDFWTIGLDPLDYTDEENKTNATRFAKRLVHAFIGKAFIQKRISVPNKLMEDCDFSDISLADREAIYTHESITPEDYTFGQRGILTASSDTRLSSQPFQKSEPAFLIEPILTKNSFNPAFSTTAAFFAPLRNPEVYLSYWIQYILLISPDEFYQRFEKYPKIMKQFELVTSHFKREYGIDLIAISTDLNPATN